MPFRTAPLILILAACALHGQVDVLTAQYDLSRTSSNTREQTLTQANVNAAQFGKLFSRTVDAPFYASPLIATNLDIAEFGVKNVVFVATLGNTLYAFDADDPNASNPYWSLNVGTPMNRGCCFLGPTIGILSTPVIDRSTNTIYFTAIVQNSDIGLYLYAADLSTGALKFNSPQRITYTFPTGITVSQANLPGNASWLQRSGLLLVNGVLYVGTSAVWQGSTIFSQEGFIQAFQANDLSVVLGTFETTPSGAGGAFWQAGRGLAADSSGNVFAVVDSGSYNPLSSFGNSVLRFNPGTVTVADWFTPANWSSLYADDLDLTANGVTLIPGTTLAFAGGKAGVIYLLNQSSLGGLEPGSGNAPLQQFQASQGCGTQQCGQHLPTAYWPNATNPFLYVWDVYDFLRAYPFDLVSQRFQTSNASAGTLLPSRTGGMTISSNGDTNGTGIVWAATAAADPLTTAVPGTLRAYNANNITQELYDSDQNSCRDSMGSFVKMSTPIVANGKVYVNTQSNVLPVYGLLSSVPPGSPPPGTVQVTVNTNIAGPTVTVDSNSPCAGSAEFNWTPGSQHTIAAPSPQTGLPGTSPQAGTPGTQFVWTGWSDGGSISHSVAPTVSTTYTATFSTQYLLTVSVLPVAGGTVTASPASASGYYASGAQVQLTAAPVSGCVFVNWTGSLTGSANPQTITMSAPQSVTANFQCTASAPVSFVTGYANKLLRNDFSGWAGMAFTVGSRALTVSALGRLAVYSDNGTHQVKLVNANTGSDVVGGAVSISMPAGNAGQFAWATLASPVTLQPNTTYYLASQERSGGDLWYDFGPIATTSDASVPNAIFSSDSVGWLPMSSSDSSYIPVSFLYTLGAPAQYLLTTAVSPLAAGTIAASPSSTDGYYNTGTSVQLTATPAGGCTFLYWTGALTGSTNPQSVNMSAAQSVTANFQCSAPAGTAFLTGYALNNPSLRHDFSGWVGMKLTVGANQLSVSAMGRICVAGNVMPHVVKFVNAGDGSDVPGASASVNMAGCQPNQFAYGAITPITLPAGASYYLVTQETYGGDQWYDGGAIAATNVAAVNSAVYSYNGAWYPIGAANTSYVPSNFQYSVVTPSPITVTVQASPAGPSFSVDGTTYTSGQVLTWSSGSSHTISATSPQNAGVGTQSVWSGWSDGGVISHAVAPANGITYTASFTTQYLLTTNVSPAGSGSVSGGGYYDSGTPVTLTATPAAGCTFQSWGGALSGATSPQSFAVSAPVTVTANFQCSGPPPAGFITRYALNSPSLRSDFTGWVGMKLTAGANPVTVSALGRICVANNAQTHVVKFVNVSDGSDVGGASASVNMAGCNPGQFAYASITPVTLTVGASYYLVSQETQGGDRWYDGGAITAANVAAVNSAVYSYNGAWYPIGAANTSYVPPNFQYSVVTPSPITVNVAASPTGPSFSVDGSTYSAAQTLTWSSGTSHTIAAASPQSTGSGTQYAWSGWSDGGAISHTVAPANGMTYTANFTTQYLLAANVSPAGSGSVSAGGYYDSGTPVTLTATPVSGCTFQNWSGALSGTANSQTVTMSAPQTVTANFQCSGPPPAGFVTGYALNGPSLRNDFTGWVGMKLTVGANPLAISALGRICVANNTQTHIVKFVNAGDGSDVAGASASLNMAGCTPGQFVYATIAPATLAARASYYLTSQEAQGGDRWYDGGTISAANVAGVNSAVYSYNGVWYPIGAGNTSYVPPNFQYSVVTPAPISVTVQASPPGPSFTVDGSTSTTAQTLTWTGGTSHTIATTSPQSAGAGTQYAWSGWSDGGAISHAVNPASGSSYTATFTTQYLLTSNVSPSGSGSVSAGGYYNSGTSVQLTATPAANCAFANWSGSLSGSTNPTSITMSGPQTVTANFQCTAPPPAGFITSYALNSPSLRSDFTGWVGMKLTVGTTPLYVSALGRICVANNAQIHVVKLVNVSDGNDVAGASANVNMAGCTAGQFTYASITPITLAAGSSYYLVSQETQGGDRWLDQGAIATKTDASVKSAAYSYNGVWYSLGSANTSYVPPNFLYSTTAPLTRRQVNIAMVVDRSGSLATTGSCGAMKQAAINFVSKFVNGTDSIGLVTFASTTGVVFPITNNFQTANPNVPAYLNNIVCQGATSSAMALWYGYDQLVGLNQPGALNVILLVTDGKPSSVNVNMPISNSSACTSPHPGSPKYINGLYSTYTNVSQFFGLLQPTPNANTIANSDFYLTSDGNSSAGCAYAQDWSSNSTNTSDFLGVPTHDVFGSNLNNGFQPITLSGAYIDLGNSNNAESMVENAADDAATQIRSGAVESGPLPNAGKGLSNVIIYSVGLGNAPYPLSVPLLERISNDPRSSIYSTNQPAGLFALAPTTADLDAAFSTIASEIFRIAQ